MDVYWHPKSERVQGEQNARNLKELRVKFEAIYKKKRVQVFHQVQNSKKQMKAGREGGVHLIVSKCLEFW